MRVRSVKADAIPCPPLEALRIAVAEAIARHHKLGHPVAIGRGTKVYWLFPDGREVLDEDLEEPAQPPIP